LIALVFSYRRFRKNVANQSIFPVFKLLRVGCGKEEDYLKPPFSAWEPQGGLAIVSGLADMFMNADSHRTDLLASVR